MTPTPACVRWRSWRRRHPDARCGRAASQAAAITSRGTSASTPGYARPPRRPLGDRLRRHELANPDKRARFSATWLLVRPAPGANIATAIEAEGLRRARDRGERGNIRHLASAALSNLVDAAPEALSDRVVTRSSRRGRSGKTCADAHDREDLPGRGPQQGVRIARLRAEPPADRHADFVIKNRDAIRVFPAR